MKKAKWIRLNYQIKGIIGNMEEKHKDIKLVRGYLMDI